MTEGYSGGWGSAYAQINEINRKKREESLEYRLREEVTNLTRKNLELSNEIVDLVCENGRLKRHIEKIKLRDLP